MKILMAILSLSIQCTIGNLQINQVHAIDIQSSWETLADTATVQIPFLQGKIDVSETRESLADQITQGDRVQIQMSANDFSFNEFQGFVKRVKPKRPLEIECEDATYLFRKINLEKSWKNTTLKDIINYIVSQVNAYSDYKITIANDIPLINFKKFRLDNVNGAQALNELKDKYNLAIYFRNFFLYVGLPYQVENAGTVNYSLAGNVAENNLEWRREDQNNIKLKAIALQQDNETIEVEVGDNEGERRTKVYTGITNRDQLRSIAEEDIKQFRYTGYEGSLRAFLIPYVVHSMTSNLSDPDYEKRGGNYLIKKVNTSFSTSKGIKRKIEIGRQV